MIIEKYKHPILFYGLSIAIPWLLWSVAGYMSHISPGNDILLITTGILSIMGLISPACIAYIIVLQERQLKKDLLNRFLNFKTIKPGYLFLTCLLMPASILLAQALSLFFGYSANQFSFSDGLSFSAGILPAWFILLMAPFLEELGWHSYGTDCLRSRFNLFNTSLIFALFWGLWHFPLAFIKDYYQSNLVETGIIYSLNFLISLIPFVIIMNWLYYKTGRNITVTIIFHITAGLFNEIFATHPMSKVIQTVILLFFSIYLLIKEKEFFFNKQNY